MPDRTPNDDLHEPLLQLIVATQQLSAQERATEVKRMLDTINERVAVNTEAARDSIKYRKRYAAWDTLLRFVGMAIFALCLNWIRMQFESGKLSGQEVGTIIFNLVLGLATIVGASALLAWTSRASKGE